MDRTIAAAFVTAALLLAGACAGAGAPQPEWRAGHEEIPVGIAFWDARHGVLIARPVRRGCGARPCPGTIETTSDGGARWTVRTHLRAPLATVAVAPGSEAFVTTGQCLEGCRPMGLLASRDRGRTWRRLPGVRVAQPSFASATTGWALAGRPGAAIAAVTADRGRTWRTLRVSCPRPDIIADAISAATGSAASVLCVSGNPATDMEAKALLRTTDGGRTWATADVTGLPGLDRGTHAHGLPLIGFIPGMDIRPDGHGWLWLDRGRLYRTDDAEHWRVAGRVLQPDVNHFVAADLVSDTTGFALLWQGHTSLIRTADGGRTWTTVRAFAG